MIRRTARQRRDYLYRKQLALKDASIAQRRSQLKASLASGKPLQKDIADDDQLRKDFKYDESKRGEGEDEEAVMDDEYEALSGIAEPKLLITTSRDPSSRLMQFSKVCVYTHEYVAFFLPITYPRFFPLHCCIKK